MARRTYTSNIKSLLHFNYPYYNEPSDGLGDEVSRETWTRQGAVKLVGTETPNDGIVEGTPKFGYRCLQTEGNSSYIASTNLSGIWNTGANDPREIDMWIRPTASAQGNILTLMNGSVAVFTLAKSEANAITLSNTTTTITSTGTLELHSWQHLRITFLGEQVDIRINGTQTDALTFALNVTVTEARLGGITGQIDEFCYKHSAEGSGVINDEYQASLNFADIGGSGTGSNGDITVNSDCVLNSYARVYSANGRVLATGAWTTGLIGSPHIGDEVLLHVTALSGSDSTYAGNYAFRKVAAINGTSLTLDREVLDEFPLATIAGDYVVQIIKIPNFKSFTLNAGKKITALNYSADTGGGLIAFRCKGDAKINGSILCSGYGPTRTDLLQITHAKLIDNFVLNRGGGIMIVAGGTLTAPSTARIGATWDGSTKAGVYVSKANGTNAGAGYGAGGGSDIDSLSYGGNGGVGGAGGGHDGSPTHYGYAGGSAGKHGNTGGNYFDYGVNQPGRYGGTQGKHAGANGYRGGGGGAGGNGTGATGLVSVSGANVIIAAKSLSIDPAALSTGGEGGKCQNAGYECGGGGTGFCYIACEEVL